MTGGIHLQSRSLQIYSGVMANAYSVTHDKPVTWDVTVTDRVAASKFFSIRNYLVELRSKKLSGKR
jgi:hypothetical protein